MPGRALSIHTQSSSLVLGPNPQQQALAQLEALRATLGDAAVDAAIAALNGKAPQPEHAAVPPRRLRQVSVLFADIANSTSMLEHVGAEEALDLLSRAVQGFADRVKQWDGEVLRFTGDGIKAVFGGHGTREDDAERAVRAGLQMLADAAGLAEQARRDLGFDRFGVRVGIHTGPVLLGGGFEAERSAMGQAVNLAARMEQSAPVGRLRISEGTWNLVRGLFVAKEQAPIVVKGHDEPMRTWLVDAVVTEAEQQAQRGLEGVHAPLVGRDDELTQLLSHHAQVCKERQSGVALVLGEAGLGKTRLRRELLRALDLRDGMPGLLQARANPSGALQPYGLVRQLLARGVGISDDLPADDARARLVAGLTPWLGAGAEAGAACIGHLIGLDFGEHAAVRAAGGAQLRTRAFEALNAVLHAMARHAPLVVVLDDLHWADDGSLDFVRALLAPQELPLWLVLLARPALLENQALDLPPAPRGLLLTLGPLEESAGRALLDALLAPLPDAAVQLKQTLLDRAAGNPLFLEALVRMLIDDGVIDTRQQPWRLRDAHLDALRVPPTLVGVLQARLDALPPAELRALQSASIIGPVFWRDALQALDPDAVAGLPALQRRKLVVQRAGSAFASAVEYRFAHQLLQETTYETVLKPQRIDGHARVAHWLAGRVSDRAGEFLAITAEQYEHAGDSAWALEYWDRAQADAGERYAHDAALQFTDRALAQPALTDARWRCYLLSTRFKLLEHLARRADADAALATLEAFAEASGDAAMRAEAKGHRMLRADYEGKPQLARALADEILRLAGGVPDGLAAPAASLAYGELAWLAVQEGHFAEVEKLIEAGVEQARIAERLPRRYGRPAGREHSLRAIGIDSLLDQARYTEALAAIAQARASGGATFTAYDRFNLVNREWLALSRIGRLDEAWAVNAEQMRIVDATGIARLLPPALLCTAELALLRRDLDTAEAMLARAAAAVAVTDIGFNLARLHELKGRLALARGDREAARAAWCESMAINRARGRSGAAAQLGCEVALLDLRLGRPEDARAGVDAGLAFVAADPAQQPLWAEPLVAAALVLDALDDPRAAALRGELQQRLDQQLLRLDSIAERRRLVRNVPCWGDAARLLGDERLLAWLDAPR